VPTIGLLSIFLEIEAGLEPAASKLEHLYRLYYALEVAS